MADPRCAGSRIPNVDGPKASSCDGVEAGVRLPATAILPEAMPMEMTVYHWILIAAFVGIVIWAFGRKRRSRFEKDGRIPFDEGNG
jgi:hypothetical protein